MDVKDILNKDDLIATLGMIKEKADKNFDDFSIAIVFNDGDTVVYQFEQQTILKCRR